jgi:hypothetical protein
MMTEREDLLGCYSDLYKDLCGFRPSLERLASCPMEELRAAVDRVAEDLRQEIAREAAEAEAHRVERDYDDPRDADEYPTSGEGWSFTPAD